MVIIGSARIDENGKLFGGIPGDQKQKNIPDKLGEVSMQAFYIHSKGWYIIRPKDPKVAIKISASMINACNNIYVGYNQYKRLDILKDGTNSKKPTSCDCSSLIRQCIKEASGKDPGNFTTENLISILNKTNLFERKKAYKSGMILYTGDILVTKTKGHVVCVVDGAARTINNDEYYPVYSGSTTSIVTALNAIGENDVSYTHRSKIAKVNEILSYSGTSAQNLYMLNLLKQGNLKKSN